MSGEVRSDGPPTQGTAAAWSTPSRVGRLTRGGGLPWAYRLVPFGIAALIGLAGIGGYGIIRESFREDLRSDLRTVLEADTEALRMWADSRCKLGEAVARSPAALAAAGKVAALAAAGSTAEALRTSDAVAHLSDAIGPDLARAGFVGYVLLDAGGRVLAAPHLEVIGTRLPEKQAGMLGSVIDGRTRLLSPCTTEPVSAPLPGSPGRAPMMLIATPAAAQAGAAACVLALQVPIARDFTRILEIARPGDTGETYAFDADGRLLSASRFEDQLRAAGLLAGGTGSPLNVHIRDPGGNLLEGHRPTSAPRARPLTRMAASAVSGGAGVDVDGYRDYRGVPVVGAWEWIPDLDLGVATEVDVAEAYRPLSLVNLAFWMLFGAAALAGVLLTLGSFVVHKLHRTVRHVKQLGQYTLIEKIGEGAMGKVFRATHAMLRRPTAVKLLENREPSAIARFEREVQLTSQLSHPNTIAVYDFGRTQDGLFYYAMEYLDGIDLADLVRIEGAIAPGRVIHLMRQVCASLAEAHDRGLVHRDVKPSNIMVTVRGGAPDFVKVLDFGLVKRMERGRDLLTTMGVVFGTPGFIPPETLVDPQQFDARGDLYAVGAVAYELLTGRTVFDRTTAYELCRRHVEETPPPPSVRLGHPVPLDLELVVMKALAKDPRARPQSARDLARMLDACDVPRWTEDDARAWWELRAAAVDARKREQRSPVSASERTVPKKVAPTHLPSEAEAAMESGAA